MRSQAPVLAGGDGEAHIVAATYCDDGVCVDAAVGMHSSDSLTQEVGCAAGGVGPPLSEPCGQHAFSSRCDGKQWVIAPLTDVVVPAPSSLPSPYVSQTMESKSMVRGSSPGPTPASQVRAGSSRLTRSSWGTCPQRKLRRTVPKVDGAFTV